MYFAHKYCTFATGMLLALVSVSIHPNIFSIPDVSVVPTGAVGSGYCLQVPGTPSISGYTYKHKETHAVLQNTCKGMN